jgi:hypothetical protein
MTYLPYKYISLHCSYRRISSIYISAVVMSQYVSSALLILDAKISKHHKAQDVDIIFKTATMITNHQDEQRQRQQQH